MLDNTQAILIEATSWDKVQPQKLCPISCVSWNCKGYSMHINILIETLFSIIDLMYTAQI